MLVRTITVTIEISTTEIKSLFSETFQKEEKMR